jgi:hypothetical protein
MNRGENTKAKLIDTSLLNKSDSRSIIKGLKPEKLSLKPEKFQKEKPALSPFKILSCIIPTDLVFRFTINPLEIARVRISKDLMSCSPSNCASLTGEPISCARCLPTRSVPGVIFHIGK